MIYREIHGCRICNNECFTPIVDLGEHALTGVFPKYRDEMVESGPLTLVKCDDSRNKNACGLVQLLHDYDLEQLYGDNYGYRSGLNQSMISHLRGLVKKICDRVSLEEDDLVVDIGSNDGTLLREYGDRKLKLVGIDPTSKKFKEFYPEHIQYIPDFFSEKIIQDRFNQKAKVITSIAMFYDLENPLDFVRQIKNSLSIDGVWVFEQSYMPTMIDRLAYDTICHEHLEYYSLKQIKWMMDQCGMKIIDVDFNDVNGGSFAMMVSLNESKYLEAKKQVEEVLSAEEKRGFSESEIYDRFCNRIFQHKEKFIKSLDGVKKKGKTVLGYGASTKGNVILQFCGITEKEIPFIAEVNEFKFGRFTPGSVISIISEKEAREMNPNYFVVLPWHFKEGIVMREQEYLNRGGKLFFPLPELEII